MLAQQAGQAATSFYENGPVRIHFEETGSGFPLLLIAGGGLNSAISYFTRTAPFNPIEEFKGEYRCIATDLRNANGGQSSGPLEIDRPWDSHTDDQLGVMDYLGIDKFIDGLMHRWPFHLEPFEASTRSNCRRCVSTAGRFLAGGAHPNL
jgi:pimeloyl-ACP methyl ester carboxylesterase